MIGATAANSIAVLPPSHLRYLAIANAPLEKIDSFARMPLTGFQIPTIGIEV
jgi:hypothetical protein